VAPLVVDDIADVSAEALPIASVGTKSTIPVARTMPAAPFTRADPAFAHALPTGATRFRDQPPPKGVTRSHNPTCAAAVPAPQLLPNVGSGQATISLRSLGLSLRVRPSVRGVRR
jgi:hypothetical protein